MYTPHIQPVMQVYWKWLVTKVPLWLAPNLITFIGFVINVVTTLPIIILDSNCNGIVSLSWRKNLTLGSSLNCEDKCKLGSLPYLCTKNETMTPFHVATLTVQIEHI